VGPILILGVFIEILFMLSFGWMLKRFGIKRLMAAGLALQVLRVGLLAAFPSLTMALLTQVCHGMWTLVIHVCPPIYLDRCAEGDYRHSIQGVFHMLVYGGGRLLGSYLGGFVADWSLLGAFWYAAGLLVLSTGVCLLAFKPTDEPTAAEPQKMPGQAAAAKELPA
jgi:PPP family 3-phenylpropionic acid transporter